MKRIIAFYGLITFLLIFTLTACDSTASRKKIGNSSDTSSGVRNGNMPIRDTATNRNNGRQDSAVQSKKPNTGKGNADPSGHVQNQ